MSATEALAFYQTSPVKRKRRTNGEMGAMLDSIRTILAGEAHPITIRHLFYRLVGLRTIEKTETAYKGLCSHLSRWRRCGDIGWDRFTDSTRWHIQRATFGSMADALQNTVETYRRDLWSTQACYIEVWVEKDAIAGIVSDVANSFGVPVFVARGFASMSSLWGAANTFKRMARAQKRVIIYHFGDHDPSGIAAGKSALNCLRDDLHVDLEFIRAAVTPEQIINMRLPTRPTKRTGTHAKHWTGGDSVELDTIPSGQLRELVKDCIVRHIEPHAWNQLRNTEKLERETLRSFVGNLRRAA